MANIRWTVIVQTGWVAVAFAHLPLDAVFVAFIVLGAFELALPLLTQGSAGGTPGTLTMSPNGTACSPSSFSGRASSGPLRPRAPFWAVWTGPNGAATRSPWSSPAWD